MIHLQKIATLPSGSYAMAIVIRNCAEAIAITEAPETLKQFMKQRFRWNYGIMQSFWKNKDACFNPRYKSLGLVALPNILLFQVLTPIFAPIADLLFILSLIWNRHDPESMNQILFFYGLFLVSGCGCFSVSLCI